MHVAFWSPAWPLEKYPNGIITHVHAMKLELERRGHRVSVFTATLDDSGRGDGVFPVQRSRWDNLRDRMSRVRGEWTSFGLSTAIAAAIAREHRRNPIDIIEMEESFGWCAEVQQRTALPMVVKLHGPAFLTLMEGERVTPFGREKVAREGRALARCHTIVSPSQANLRRTIERYGLADKDTQVIVNPIAMEESGPVWDLSGCERRTVLFVGRFDLHKGADVVLRAMLSVLQTYPDARLVFVGPDKGLPAPGGGTQRFAAYRDALFPPEARARIDFRGRLPHAELGALRAAAMVTVVASRWESQCYTLLEAMAQGCPVISTDAGACPEIVTHGKTGLIARSEDPDAFAAQICAVFREPDAAAVMGRAAREHVRQHFSATTVVDAMLERFQRTIAAHRAR